METVSGLLVVMDQYPWGTDTESVTVVADTRTHFIPKSKLMRWTLEWLCDDE